MKQLNLNTTIGEWVSQRPHASQVFASLQVDCGASRGTALQQECWERRLTPQDVLAQLRGVTESADSDKRLWE